MTVARPHSAGGELRTDFGNLDHPTMKAMLDRGDPRTISAMASTWEAAGSRISEQAAGFEEGLATLRQRWRGPAADAYMAKMDGLAATLRGTAEACFRTRGALGAAAEALTAAKQQMPAPSAGNDGHSRAVAVMRQLSDQYLTAQAAIPAPPGYSGPQIPSVHDAGCQAAPAHTDSPAGAPVGAAPGTPPGSAPPRGHIVLTSAAVPGHPPAASVAPASPAGNPPPGAVLPGAPSGGQAGMAGAAGAASMAGAAGVAGAATSTGAGATAGPAGGAAAQVTPIPPGMPLFPAAGGVAGTAAATGSPGQGRSGASGLFAEQRGTGAPGLAPGGVIETSPADVIGARSPSDHGRAPVPGHHPVAPLSGAGATAVPSGTALTPLPPREAGAQPAGTRRTTWLIESRGIWRTGPAAPPVLGDQHHDRDR